jgi:hypothetical protein
MGLIWRSSQSFRDRAERLDGFWIAVDEHGLCSIHLGLQLKGLKRPTYDRLSIDLLHHVDG